MSKNIHKNTQKRWEPRIMTGYAAVDWKGTPTGYVCYAKLDLLSNHKPVHIIRACDYRKLLAYAKKGGLE